MSQKMGCNGTVGSRLTHIIQTMRMTDMTHSNDTTTRTIASYAPNTNDAHRNSHVGRRLNKFGRRADGIEHSAGDREATGHPQDQEARKVQKTQMNRKIHAKKAPEVIMDLS